LVSLRSWDSVTVRLSKPTKSGVPRIICLKEGIKEGKGIGGLKNLEKVLGLKVFPWEVWKSPEWE